MLSKLDQFKINKTNWKLCKLGSMATEISIRVDNPETSKYDRFVGLEHFESGEIKIKQWSTTESLTSSAKAFENGDILFARRNAYLRRASLVDFNGCCSGDAFVLRENKEKIVPGFLIFLLNSDDLWIYANSKAAGTMSKRVKWDDLSKYELLLPPLNEQEALSELLWSNNNEIESKGYLLDISKKFYEVQKNQLLLVGFGKNNKYCNFFKTDIKTDWTTTTIGDLLAKNYITDIQDGNHGELHPKASDYCDDGIPFIMANTLKDGEINFDLTKKLSKSLTDKLRIGFSKPNDLLLSHKGTIGEVAIVPENIKWPYLMLTPQITYYRVNPEKLINKFLYFVFSSKYFQEQLLKKSTQSTRSYIGITAQEELKVVMPKTLSEQLDIVEKLSQIEQNLKLIRVMLNSSKMLQKSLINKIF